MQNIVFKLMIALFVFMPGSQFHINAYAENVDVVNKGFSLNELKGKTSFNCFIPKEIAKDWNIELKYPEQVHKNMEKVQIHFLNREGTQLKVAIIESAATDKDIQPGEHGERVKINNINGVFHPLTPTKRIKDVQGGQLMWVQDGTMIELFSSRISKQELITIAQSMQKL
ncbi:MULTISPECIES: DUF4367 domain-containing protein [Bacillus cereus group]|uniref:DUF4367 domain-containing protein n=1 Tax=Bacillus paranthracis TaxID=2026186 RepID=A0A5M9GL77_9BACI|nr:MULTISPECIES: DUF4367 domain-containing protein [Bacillus cereus group]MBQ6351130.1 DUF4367 domain-containing protein [Methanobrevibacter sp.]KAA8473468.1 DUF4367 domain-containing protein [Bacillus paranthracis]KXX98063.1 hypothetical protein AT271_20965 [Bacillus cereus]KXY95007.1 hypothetical protein AT279_00585 [Bacillus cereus]MBL3853890.1 DUF4367 domain-containing protein [Bacillus cereus]